MIAFSNVNIYDRALTTFPGIGGDSVLRYLPVPWDPRADTNGPAPEVNTVVDLILEHARERPGESLGVITMGIRHRDRIEERLHQRLREDRQLADELADSSMKAARSGSSSRTWNASRVTSATRSSCPSAHG